MLNIKNIYLIRIALYRETELASYFLAHVKLSKKPSMPASVLTYKSLN